MDKPSLGVVLPTAYAGTCLREVSCQSPCHSISGTIAKLSNYIPSPFPTCLSLGAPHKCSLSNFHLNSYLLSYSLEVGGGMMLDKQAVPLASLAWTISPNSSQVGRVWAMLQMNGSVFNVPTSGQCHWH